LVQGQKFHLYLRDVGQVGKHLKYPGTLAAGEDFRESLFPLSFVVMDPPGVYALPPPKLAAPMKTVLKMMMTRRSTP
jgi:hypothetical protein